MDGDVRAQSISTSSLELAVVDSVGGCRWLALPWVIMPRYWVCVDRAWILMVYNRKSHKIRTSSAEPGEKERDDRSKEE